MIKLLTILGFIFSASALYGVDYYQDNFDGGQDYANNNYINSTFYKHGSPDTSDQNTSPGSGYEALDPKTPGFDVGGIKAMEGFFIKIEDAQDQTTNFFAYPLIMKNGSGK